MIVDEYCHIEFEGESISLSYLPDHSDLEIVLKPDDPDIPTGFDTNAGKIKMPSVILVGKLDAVLEFIDRYRSGQKAMEYIKSISITFEYKDQCNLEISERQIKSLSLFNIPVGITCYESE